MLPVLHLVLTQIDISPPPASNANLNGLIGDGRIATYSCDSALYELDGSCSIEFEVEGGWPTAPEYKGKINITDITDCPAFLLMAGHTSNKPLRSCKTQQNRYVVNT